MKKCWTFLILAVTAMLILTACGQKGVQTEEDNSVQKSSETSDGQEESQKISFGDFTSQTLDGEEVTQEIFSEAEVTMVNIWGTFCSPCINEMPELGEISRKYADRNVQIIGIIGDVYESGDETAQEIIETTKADYLHMIASEDLQKGILSEITAYPTTIFVDAEGTQIGEMYIGARDQAAWELIVEQMLSEVH
ncbi:MAG: TlpA family protein disulfide reductase [Dorea sp.]|nr:TlpA family protein disulfide reductase [Dorea sp.]MDY2812840.1 TlpA disulfide reductase family protein [Dorea sp.]